MSSAEITWRGGSCNTSSSSTARSGSSASAISARAWRASAPPGFACACSPTIRRSPTEAVKERGAEKVEELKELLAASDAVSLHLPLTGKTRHIIGRAELRAMKPTAILVNAARGPLVDEAALAEALNEGQIAGAALDVFEVEPPAPDNPILSARNVVLSPHTAGNTVEAARYLAIAAAEIVIAAMAGRRPENILNPEVWDKRRQ